MNEKNVIKVTGETFLSIPLVDTSLALEIAEINAKESCAVKTKLVKLYGADVEIIADGKEKRVCDLADEKNVCVSAQRDFKKARYNALDAMRVIERLTHDDGCPWARAQTHESIRVNMIEEAYEAVDAIDKRDVENMREEFGDVFLQSLLQSDIARRAGEFDFCDVCDELCKKLIGRHTFIFGDDDAGNADEALALWEKAKATEKHYDTVKSQLQKLPDEFPSLLRCQKAYKKIKKSGARVDPYADLQTALESKNHAAAIVALCSIMADEGVDAEVALNAEVRGIIENL